MIFLSYFCENECVVYNVSNANLHLLSSFNAELLQLIKQKVSEKELVIQISNFYQLEEIEAQSVLSNLKSEYQNLGLLD